jgi:hypothetical protein
LALDPARFAGADNGIYPGVDEPLWSPVLVEAGSAPPDADGDGVADASDAFPNDPAEAFDTDGDGIGNTADPDDDNDGMPDSYEQANELNPRGDDRLFDLDRDGRNNRAEHEAGTAANDPTSWFRIGRLAVMAPGRLRLEWNAVPGRRYSVLRLLPPPALPELLASGITVAEPGTVFREIDARAPTGLYFLRVDLIALP